VTKVRYTTDDIKTIALFESMTGAKIKDFLRQDNTLCFLVQTGDMGLAIGKAGVKIEKLRKAIPHNVMVFEYDSNEEKFLKNMLHPVEVHGLEIATTSGEKTAIVEVAREDRARVVGPAGARIKAIKEFAKRHCGIDTINLRAI
jgi:transcription termination/antitermination protein NusA